MNCAFEMGMPRPTASLKPFSARSRGSLETKMHMSREGSKTGQGTLLQQPPLLGAKRRHSTPPHSPQMSRTYCQWRFSHLGFAQHQAKKHGPLANRTMPRTEAQLDIRALPYRNRRGPKTIPACNFGERSGMVTAMVLISLCSHFHPHGRRQASTEGRNSGHQTKTVYASRAWNNHKWMCPDLADKSFGKRLRLATASAPYLPNPSA